MKCKIYTKKTQHQRRRRRRIKTKINSQQFKYSNNDLEMNKEEEINARSNTLRMKKNGVFFLCWFIRCIHFQWVPLVFAFPLWFPVPSAQPSTVKPKHHNANIKSSHFLGCICGCKTLWLGWCMLLKSNIAVCNSRQQQKTSSEVIYKWVLPSFTMNVARKSTIHSDE